MKRFWLLISLISFLALDISAQKTDPDPDAEGDIGIAISTKGKGGLKSAGDPYFDYTGSLQRGQIKHFYEPKDEITDRYKYEIELVALEGDPDLFIYGHAPYRFIRKSDNEHSQTERSFYEISDLRGHEHQFVIKVKGYTHCRYRIIVRKIPTRHCQTDWWMECDGNRQPEHNCELRIPQGQNIHLKAGVASHNDIEEVTLVVEDMAFVDSNFPYEWNNVLNNAGAGTYRISITILDKCGDTHRQDCVIIIERPQCVSDFVIECNGNRPPSHNCEQVIVQGQSISIKTIASREQDIKEATLVIDDMGFFDNSAPFQWDDVLRNAGPGRYNISITVMDHCGNTERKDCVIIIERPQCMSDFVIECNGNRPPSHNCEQVIVQGQTITLKASIEQEGDIKEAMLVIDDMAFFDNSAPFQWDDVLRNSGPGRYSISITVTDKCGKTERKDCVIIIERPQCMSDFVIECNGNRPPSHNCEQVIVQGQTITLKASIEQEGDIKEAMLVIDDMAFFDNSAPFQWDDVLRNSGPGRYSISITVTDKCGKTERKDCVIIIERPHCMSDFVIECNGNRPPSHNCEQVIVQGQTITLKASIEQEGDIKEAMLVIDDMAFFDNSAPFQWDDVLRNSGPGRYSISITVTDKCGKTERKDCVIIIERPQCMSDFVIECNGNRPPSHNCEQVIVHGQSISLKASIEQEGDIKEAMLVIDDMGFFDNSAPFQWDDVLKNSGPGRYSISITVTDKCGKTERKDCVIIIQEDDCNSDFTIECDGTHLPTSNCEQRITQGQRVTINAGVTMDQEIKDAMLIIGDMAMVDNSFPFQWDDVFKNSGPGRYNISITVTDKCGNTSRKDCVIIIEPKDCQVDFWMECDGNHLPDNNCELRIAQGQNILIKAGVQMHSDIQEVHLIIDDMAFVDNSFPYEWQNPLANSGPGTYNISISVIDICGNSHTQHCTIIVEGTECLDPSRINNAVYCVGDEKVCGCDGITYDNACIAEYLHGVTSWSEGPCGGGDDPCILGVDLVGDINVNQSSADLILEVISPFAHEITQVKFYVNMIQMQTVTSRPFRINHIINSGGSYTVNAEIFYAQTSQVCTLTQDFDIDLFPNGDGCIDPSRINNAVFCIGDEKVCGCDGVTYDNECIAEYLHGVTSWTSGDCADAYGPVDNSCQFIDEFKITQQGSVFGTTVSLGLESFYLHELTTVEYYINGTHEQTVSQSPFSHQYRPNTTGEHNFTARIFYAQTNQYCDLTKSIFIN